MRSTLHSDTEPAGPAPPSALAATLMSSGCGGHTTRMSHDGAGAAGDCTAGGCGGAAAIGTSGAVGAVTEAAKEPREGSSDRPDDGCVGSGEAAWGDAGAL